MDFKDVKLSHYIGRQQMSAIQAGLRGEEKEFFKTKLVEITKTIAAMPQTYDQEGKGDEAIVTLHYFTSGCDWWITERDKGNPDDEEPGRQDQAFGFACLNGDIDNAELGYISIPELLDNRAELDLYWTPTTLGAIKKKLGCLV
jgi:hypothetical protein